MQLAIETTGRHGSIALVDTVDQDLPNIIDHTVLPPQSRTAQSRTAQSLAPQIKHLLDRTQTRPADLKFVSVAIGPGSFTGLRVGVTTGKTLAYAWQIPLVCVGSLDAIAAETFRVHDRLERLTVAIDAYRQQSYVADYHRAADSTDAFQNGWFAGRADEVTAMPITELNAKLSDMESRHFVTGDAKLFPQSKKFLDRPCDAIGVAIVANRLAEHQQWSDPLAAVPRYLKPSAASEKHDSNRTPQPPTLF